MKKLLVILLALVFISPIFAELTDEDAALLEAAYNRIEFLENEVEVLDQALADSNVVLQSAYDRIDKDGIEIEELRGAVKTLIKNGVEFKTYDWNIILTTGYPVSMGVMVGYNFPFFTNIGLVAGFDYYFEDQFPAFKAGLKINLGKN